MSVAVGVDFGTDFIRVAVFQNGYAQLIANDDGERHTPAIVAFSVEETSFGTGSRGQVVRSPQSTVTGFKTLVGKMISDKDVQSFSKYCAVSVQEAKDTSALSTLEFSFELDDTERQVSLQSLLGTVFQQLKMMAESAVHQPVRDLVVAVPFNYSERERAALRSAAESVGCRIPRFIVDPCAAVLAYQLGQSAEDALHDQRILVIDWGASCLAVSLLRLQQGYYSILGQRSDSSLPSSTLDDAIVDAIVGDFKRQNRIELPHNPLKPRSSRADRKMYATCEGIKRSLSLSAQAMCAIESLHEGIDFQMALPRVRFDTLCNQVYMRVRQSVQEALNTMKMTSSDIDVLVLSGGPCRIPSIQQLFKDLFPNAKHLSSLPSDEVVALGAAIEASCLNQHPEVSTYYNGGVDVEKELDQVSNLPCVPFEIAMKINDEKEEKIFEKFTIVPVKRTKMIQLKDVQSRVKHVFTFFMKNNKEHKQIGAIEWLRTDTGNVEAEQLEIEMTLQLDQAGHLHLQLLETRSNQMHRLHL